MIDEKFVLLAFLLNTYGDLNYALATLRGQIQPNKVTWLLWAVAPLVAFLAEVSHGVGWASLMTLSVGLNPLFVFFASFVNKKANWEITKFDIGCGVVSLLAIILWYLTDNPSVAILLAIVADFIAGVPTLIKAYKFPETENPNPFIFGSIASVVTLLTLKDWSFAYSAFPLFLFAFCFVFVLLIKFKLGKVISFR